MVGKPRYLDVNIFIYWLGNHPKFGEAAYKWIKKIENSPLDEYATSSLTIYETIVIIAGLTGKNLKDKTFVEEVVNSITRIKGLTIEPLEPEDFVKALDLMNDCKLDYEDSIHLAVANRIGAKEIVSHDRDFDTTSMRRII